MTLAPCNDAERCANTATPAVLGRPASVYGVSGSLATLPPKDKSSKQTETGTHGGKAAKPAHSWLPPVCAFC